ncbi:MULTISPECIES: DUF5983 family protein [Sphingomonadales]|uniref:DUF5983 domain-containing protein n=1 Tax=Sphingobium ummariense RL-3 TaxID=1346791 RepID=T0JAM3_9SPHN|nr:MULTISPECIES: hypothetical protein [Sphingomonadaceae]EQB33877.1 hypothetical protein M529_02375 [Sphingobium ummariense RL-3]WOF45579.1 hypothetical protein KNJ79_21435 [Sphingopyxis indica]
MKPEYPLRLFFDCSTAHVSPATRTWLETLASSGEAMIAATPYGWFLWVEETPPTDQPADLSSVMDHARQLGAEYILFDRDAPENDALPVFDD